jgi:nucleoside-diphosphate-sugar epimerase
MPSNILEKDLNHIIAHTREFWEEIRNQSLFITGGTGFFGCWLLESFVWANDKLGLNASAQVLTRDRKAFEAKAPHLSHHPAVKFHEGDIRFFQFPAGEYPYIIHAATDAIKKLNDDDPLLMYETITAGTRRLLDFAKQRGARKLLLTSSGAIYGAQPPEIPCIREQYRGALDPTDPHAAYYEGKRSSEFLCATYARKYGFDTKIARCFAFVGPYLPTDRHFAIGNFIRDGLKGGPVVVTGDGTPYRSYLYAADLAIWLWTILFRGKTCIPYNVGSDQGLPISSVANVVAAVFGPNMKVTIAKKLSAARAPERYVPDIQRAKEDLGLAVFIDLPEAVRRTVEWHRHVLK